MKSTPEELKQIRSDFESAGIQILGVGNVSFAKNDEAEMRAELRIREGVGSAGDRDGPDAREAAGFIDKLVKEYNIKAAIHNHGPEDKHFPAPSDVLKAVKGMDQRMGLCIDVGHTTRTGADVVQSIKEAGLASPRHAREGSGGLDEQGQPGSRRRWRDADPAIFRQLQRMGYKGGVMLEYEINADNPLPGMQKSFAYMRGVLAGMKS